MGKYLDMFLGYISEKVPKLTICNRGLVLVKLMILFILLSVVLYLVAWTYQWVVLKKLILSELKDIIVVLFSPYAIAAIAFYGAAVIDKDNDGESDKLEKDVGTDSTSITPSTRTEQSSSNRKVADN